MDGAKLRGLGLLIGGMYALDVFSSFMSSPWSTRAFAGADASKAQHARKLVFLSIGVGVGAGVSASLLDKSPWPAVGATVTATIMYVLYEQALNGAAADAAAANA